MATVAANSTPDNPLAAAVKGGFVQITDVIAGTGFSRSKISGHVNGLRTPSLADRIAYAKCLRLTPEEFDRLWFGSGASSVSEATQVFIRQRMDDAQPQTAEA